MKILNTIGDAFTKKAKCILETVGTVDYLDLKRQEDLKKIIGRYEVVVVGLGLMFDKAVIDKGAKMRIIATASTGTDHIDIEYAKSKGIKVISLKNDRKFLNTITGTAELAFLLALSLNRNLIPAAESALEYCWTKKFRGHNLYKKTLGIVGLGRLGTMMTSYGNAFGMNVVAHDPYISNESFAKLECGNVSFEDLLRKSDVVSIHAHLDKETENMFNGSAFILMKNTAILINTARGKIVNEKDLVDALERREIAGYGADVLAQELNFNEKFENNALIEYAKKNHNVLITPHVGGVTYESREATDVFIAEKLKKNIICKT